MYNLQVLGFPLPAGFCKSAFYFPVLVGWNYLCWVNEDVDRRGRREQRGVDTDAAQKKAKLLVPQGHKMAAPGLRAAGLLGFQAWTSGASKDSIQIF